SGAAAGHALQVPRVAGRGVTRVLCRAAHGKLVAVRHPEHHRACLEQATHRGPGVRRPEALEALRTRGRLLPAHAEDVFDGEGNARERRRVSLADLAIRLVRLLLPELGREAQVCLDMRVDAFDPLDVS